MKPSPAKVATAKLAAGSRVLYHVGKRPPSPKPKRSQWHSLGQPEGDWERPWLTEPVVEGVFLTPNPLAVAENHGAMGHVYAYRVPWKVITDSGGLHRYDQATEVLIPKQLWSQVKFLGKTMTEQEFKAFWKDVATESRYIRMEFFTGYQKWLRERKPADIDTFAKGVGSKGVPLPLPGRVAAHHVERRAGVFQAPPAMLKSISEWLDALYAGVTLAKVEPEIARLRNQKAGMDAALGEMEKTLKALPSKIRALKPGGALRWKVYYSNRRGEVYHSLSGLRREKDDGFDSRYGDVPTINFYHRGRGQKRIKFDTWLGEALQLDDAIDWAAEEMQREIQKFQRAQELAEAAQARSTKDTGPELVELLLLQREARKYTAKAKAYTSKVQKVFQMDLTGWRYLKDESLPGTWSEGILVQLNFKRAVRFTGQWNNSRKTLQVNMHSAAYDLESFESSLEMLHSVLRHELQHMAQDLLSSTQGLGDQEWNPEPGAGMPPQSIRDPNYRANDSDLSHALRDVEFQTRLADEIQAFEAWVKHIPLNLRRKAIRSWVQLPANYTPEELAQIKKVKRYEWAMVHEREFFRQLKRHQKEKWQKAVSEFTGAVMSKLEIPSQAARAASASPSQVSFALRLLNQAIRGGWLDQDEMLLEEQLWGMSKKDLSELITSLKTLKPFTVVPYGGGGYKLVRKQAEYPSARAAARVAARYVEALKYVSYIEGGREKIEEIVRKRRGVVTVWKGQGQMEPGMQGQVQRAMHVSFSPRRISVAEVSSLNPLLRQAMRHFVKMDSGIASLPLSLDAPDAMTVGEFLAGNEEEPGGSDVYRKFEQGGITLYHGTSSALWPTIQKKGLRPRRLSGQPPTYGDVGSGGAKPGDERLVYFTVRSNLNAAHFAARDAVSKYGGEGIVLGVKSNALDVTRLYPDEDSRQRTWEGSIKTLGAVAYMGVVSPTKLFPVERLSQDGWARWNGRE